MVRDEIQTAVNMIAAALDEISHKLPERIVAGVDEQAPRHADASALGDGQSRRMRHSDQTCIHRQSQSGGNRKFRGIHRFAGCAGQAHRAPAG